MLNESQRLLRPYALVFLATLISVSYATDHTCYVPTILERAQKHKAVPDVRPLKPIEPVPIPECSYAERFNLRQLWGPRNCFSCPRWLGETQNGHQSDLGDRVRRVLSNEVFGQDSAIDSVVAAIRAKQKGSPLVIHLVGDNGTGKTMTAQALAKALFEDPNKGGVLYIRGNSYIAHEAQVRFEHRKQLKEKISAQLAKCSNSLIIIDELEAIPRNTVVVFDQFLDATFREDLMNTGVPDPSEATFLFISDFGKEGASLDDTPDQLAARAHAESSRTWQGTKMAHLMMHIVPFMPAKESGTSELISRSMDQLFELPFFARSSVKLIGINYCDSDHMHQGLAKLTWDYTRNHEPSKVEQYRGARRFYETKIVRSIIEKVTAFETAKKLKSLPLGQPKANIILNICTNGGQKLSVEVTQPWCDDLQTQKDEL